MVIQSAGTPTAASVAVGDPSSRSRQLANRVQARVLLSQQNQDWDTVTLLASSGQQNEALDLAKELLSREEVGSSSGVAHATRYAKAINLAATRVRDARDERTELHPIADEWYRKGLHTTHALANPESAYCKIRLQSEYAYFIRSLGEGIDPISLATREADLESLISTLIKGAPVELLEFASQGWFICRWQDESLPARGRSRYAYAAARVWPDWPSAWVSMLAQMSRNSHDVAMVAKVIRG